MLYWRVRKSKSRIFFISFTSAVVAHQLQMASTASFFMTFRQGSPPNISGATVTEHEFCPTQSCKNKVCVSVCDLEKMDKLKVLVLLCMIDYQ
jgi:hypothetical protein